jgi:hypothetical protein
VGDVARDTGWPLARIRAMTPADLGPVLASWRASPPLHLMVSGYLGYEAKDDAQEDMPQTEEEARAIAASLGKELKP